MTKSDIMKDECENCTNEKLEKYKLLIEARNFHTGQFSKWSTYFYVATGALFVGYYTINNNSSSPDFSMNMGLLFLGYITGLFWFLSCKGYYLWTIHFIKFLQHFEKETFKDSSETRIYSSFYNIKAGKDKSKYISIREGANISTPKLAIAYAFIITIFWGMLIFVELLNMSCACCSNILWIISLIVTIAVTLLLSRIVGPYFQSYIDKMEDLDIK
jgi:hypothetical protein